MTVGATSPDRTFAAVIRVAGSEDHGLYDCIDSVVVNEDLDVGSSFQVRLSICRDEDGGWPILADENLKPWNRMTIIAAFPDFEDVIMDGYISHIHPETHPESNTMTVDINGVDASYHMNLEEDCETHEGSYETIAEKIIRLYDLEPKVAPEPPGSDPELVTTQRSTDLDFLRDLAERRGYEFFVRGATAFFRPPELLGKPQKLIAIDFGEQTNCDKLSIAVDGTRPTEVVSYAIDPIEGTEIKAEVSLSDLEPLGTIDLSTSRGTAQLPQRVVHLRSQAVRNEAELQARALAYLRKHGWWVKANGTLDGLVYGAVLRTRKTVNIKGFGELYNGTYYVRKVKHTLGARTYEMEFEATRNRLNQKGDEDFEGEMPSALGLPVAAGGGADADVIRVADSGFRVLPA